jgi:hypothetical protein
MKLSRNKKVVAVLLVFSSMVACTANWMFSMKTIQQQKVILKLHWNCRMA